MEVIFTLILVLAMGGGAGLLALNNLYYVCQPSEVLIFAGSGRRGYRLVKGGSSIRVPLLEQVLKMDLSNIIIELRVTNAYCRGGIPLSVSGVANIKIAGQEPAIHNAIERLLGKTREEIESLARETLEGNLRGVLASLTPEQVNEDKIAFAKSLLEEAEDDLQKLGLVLDTLQIQNISDNVSYLNSIGRRQRAQLLRDSRMAEAKAKAESAIRAAENEKITALRRIDRDIAVAQAEAERRIQDAITRRQAMIAEEEAEIGSEVARTEAEVAVQQERIKQVDQQLQADVIVPAEASCKRAIAEAKGEASRIIEDGKAQAQGLRRLAESWQSAGSNAKEIFLYQKLDVLLRTMASTVPAMDVQNVTVINGEDGNTATKLAAFFEQLRQASGIDIAETVRSFGSSQHTKNPTDSVQASPLTGSGRPPSVPPAIAPQPGPVASPFPQFSVGGQMEPTSATPLAETRVDVDPQLQERVRNLLDFVSANQSTPSEGIIRVEQAIRYDSAFREKLHAAFNAGGEEALQVLFEHPVVRISSRMVKEWLNKY